MMRTLLLFTLTIFTLGVVAQDVVATYTLGQTEVALVRHGSEAGLLYFNMHDNESTSVKAAKKIVKKYGGRLYELVHTGERRIEFEMNGQEVSIDPNRIYTEAGIWRGLEPQGITDSAIFNAIFEFGQSLIDYMQIDSQDLVIALHNNTNHNYSYLSYVEGGDYENEAAATHKGKVKDEDAFYFVTAESYFELLQNTDYNIVLQDNSAMTDDGSLSVYCGQRGIDYVNVEAQHGRKRMNRKMIRQLVQSL